MPSRSGSFAIGALALVLAATPGRAQLWSNGRWNRSTTILPSERDLWVPDTRVYEDFVVTGSGWNVTALFGDFLSDLTPSQAYWEIRTGVSDGNGGSLLFSGTSNISWLLLGPGLWEEQEYRASIGGLNLNLSAGTYWLAIAPAQNIYGRAYITGTSGSGGVNGLLNGNSYWDSASFGKNFVPTSQRFGSNTDFAYGLEGLAIATPEPRALILISTGFGLLGLGALRRRAPP